MQHETNVAADFFLVINRWLTIFFQYFLMWQMRFLRYRRVSSMLRMLLFNVALERPMEKVSSEVRALASPFNYCSWLNFCVFKVGRPPGP